MSIHDPMNRRYRSGLLARAKKYGRFRDAYSMGSTECSCTMGSVDHRDPIHHTRILFYPLNLPIPITLSLASSYFAFVPLTTSSGKLTPSLFLSPLSISQSLKYCLSKLACGWPSLYSEADQYRDESGVRSSSISISWGPLGVGKRPNSNLVSASMRPRARA